MVAGWCMHNLSLVYTSYESMSVCHVMSCHGKP